MRVKVRMYSINHFVYGNMESQGMCARDRKRIMSTQPQQLSQLLWEEDELHKTQSSSQVYYLCSFIRQNKDLTLVCLYLVVFPSSFPHLNFFICLILCLYVLFKSTMEFCRASALPCVDQICNTVAAFLNLRLSPSFILMTLPQYLLTAIYQS